MPNTVYDKEDLDKPLEAPAQDGSHDSLGVSPEVRNQETGDLENLYHSESSPSGGGSADRAGKKEKDKLDDQVGDSKKPGWKTNISNARNKVKTARNIGFAMVLVGGFVAVVMSLISFLLPYKITHIVENIEKHVGSVPQYAVEKRTQYYMSRYLMIRALEETGQFDFAGKDKGKFTYLGGSFWDNMYTNWKGAKIENDFVKKNGFKLETSVKSSSIFGKGSRLKADDFRLVDLGRGEGDPLKYRSLDKYESRELIKTFAKDETRSIQVFKRHNTRKVLYKYFGVEKWKPYEKWRDDKKHSYIEKKISLKKTLIKETVGRVNERYGLYMTCLLESVDAKSCRKELKKPDTSHSDLSDKKKGDEGKLDDTDATSPDIDKEVDSALANEADDAAAKAAAGEAAAGERSLLTELSEKIQKFFSSKFLRYASAGLGIMQALSKVYNSLDNGTINMIVYDKNSQQYVSYAKTFLSGADQIKAGGIKSLSDKGADFDIEDVRATQEVLNDYDKSPVYQANANPSSSSVAAAGQKTIWRDCDNDPTNGKETKLEAGELVCPDKRLMMDKTKFTNSPSWSLLGTVVHAYDATIGGGVDFVSNLLGSLTGAIMSTLHIDDAITKIMESIGLDKLLNKGFELLINWIAGSVITGTETGGNAYDALYAGAAVINSEVGGNSGVSKESTIGGSYLTDDQALAIKTEQDVEYQRNLDDKPFFVKYFSPDVPESLTSRLAMSTPTSIGGVASNISTIFSQPINLLSSIMIGFSGAPRANAASFASINPFHVLNMGYPVDDPVFTANNGEGMDPDEINTRYHCDLPVNKRPQNQVFGRKGDVTFDVPLENDPCLLEESTVQAATGYFTGDVGVDSFSDTASSSASEINPTTGVVSGGDTSNTPCPSDPDIKDGGIGEKYGPGKVLQYKIRLCIVMGITLNVSVAQNAANMIRAASGSGVILSGWGYRPYDRQVTLRQEHGCPDPSTPSGSCRPPTAKPGTSNHETGEAIDISGISQCPAKSGDRCVAPNNAKWLWLDANAGNYGFKPLKSEAWHWSINGK